MSTIEIWAFPAAFVAVFSLLVYRMWNGAQMLKEQGRAIRPRIPADALFGESGASGHSLESLMTRMGGASRILLVWVTAREFAVEAIFPFNVFMQGSPYDLEHRVPIGAITDARLDGRDAIRVSFSDANQKSCTLRLILKHPDQLLSVLDSVRTTRAGSR